MNCEEWRELASDYLEETLSPGRRAEVEAHLGACLNCRRDAEALRGIGRALGTLPQEETPLFFADNVLARLERESGERRGWKVLLPRLGRVGVSAALAGGVLAALGWTFFLPHGTVGQQQAAILPGNTGDTAPAVRSTSPHLSVHWTRRVDADDPALDFSLRLDNADSGSARCELPGDPTAYRLSFANKVPQTLRVPLAAARGEQTLALKIAWSAGGGRHERHLALPLPQSDTPPAARQSFGVRDLPLPDAARELARRYGQTVILDDVPAQARITLTATDETAAQTLRRQVEPLGLQVAETADGLLVTRKP